MSHLPSSSSSCAADTRDACGRLAAGAALVALLALAWRRCQERHSHRRSARSPRAPRAEQTWEAEGGRPTPSEQDVSTPPTSASKPGG